MKRFLGDIGIKAKIIRAYLEFCVWANWPFVLSFVVLFSLILEL